MRQPWFLLTGSHTQRSPLASSEDEVDDDMTPDEGILEPAAAA